MIENSKLFAEKLRKNGPILKAEKCGWIIARVGEYGETIKTYVQNGIVETTNSVKTDENGNLDIVCTASDSIGNPKIDKNGNTNTYIIPRKTFDKKYVDAKDVDKNPKVFKPTGGIMEFVQIHEDIELMAPWGEVQNLKACSFINISNENDIYGISYEEFIETYSFIDNNDIKKVSIPDNLVKNNDIER